MRLSLEQEDMVQSRRVLKSDIVLNMWSKNQAVLGIFHLLKFKLFKNANLAYPKKMQKSFSFIGESARLVA